MHKFNLILWLGEKTGMTFVNESTVSLLSSILVFLILISLSLVVWLRLRNPERHIVPSATFSVTNIFEIFIDGALSIMRGMLKEKAEKFLPLIGTLFIFIFVCNLLGFIPGFMSPTTVITTNLGCAIVVFFYYNYIGIRERGFVSYLKHFLGPVLWLAPLFLFIELTSHLVRPITLSVRLFGNMMGDHVVLDMFSGLIPLLIPIFFMVLGIFVAFIQAFVFSILSTVYIALAIEE